MENIVLENTQRSAEETDKQNLVYRQEVEGSPLTIINLDKTNNEGYFISMGKYKLTNETTLASHDIMGKRGENKSTKRTTTRNGRKIHWIEYNVKKI